MHRWQGERDYGGLWANKTKLNGVIVSDLRRSLHPHRLQARIGELTQVSIIRIFELMALDGHLKSRADVLAEFEQ